MEMIIDSEGREIKLLIEYLKGTVCIACRSYYKEVFLNLEEIPDIRTSKSNSGISIITHLN